MKASLAELDASVPQATLEERDAILALSEQFERAWHSERCPSQLKKQILRTVVEEVVVDLDDETQMLSFELRHPLEGRQPHALRDASAQRSPGRKTADDDLQIIRKMAVRYSDSFIADILNRLGRRTGMGKRWNQDRVASARRNHSIAGQAASIPDPEVLSLTESARHSGVSDTTIRRLVEAGVLPKKQLVPWAPWEIRRSDLEPRSREPRATLDRRS